MRNEQLFEQYIITSKKTGKMTNVFKTLEEGKRFLSENEGFEMTINKQLHWISHPMFQKAHPAVLNYNRLLMKNNWLRDLI